MNLARLQERAASLQPHLVPSEARRWPVYVDGDVLVYEAAYSGGVDQAAALLHVDNKIKEASELTGGSVTLLLTSTGSLKGGRKEVYPTYQENRVGREKPPLWQVVLDYCSYLPHESTAEYEADDLFAKYAYETRGKLVILSSDKDMQQLPGLHVNWSTRLMTYVPFGAYDVVSHGLQYGKKFFWLQMLMGDYADNVKGLPMYQVGDKWKPVGGVTAEKLLRGLDEKAASSLVHGLYDNYGTKTGTHLYYQTGHALWLAAGPSCLTFNEYSEVICGLPAKI